MSTDQSLVREESSSIKKTDFEEDNIGEVGVQLPPPSAVWNSQHYAESPSNSGSRNSNNPVERR
jgi:hypothetical protein